MSNTPTEKSTQENLSKSEVKSAFKGNFFSSRTVKNLDKFIDQGLIDSDELDYEKMKKEFNNLVSRTSFAKQPYRVMKHVAEKVLPRALENYKKAFSEGNLEKAAQIYNGARLVFCLIVHWSKNVQAKHLWAHNPKDLEKKNRKPEEYKLISLLGDNFYFPHPHHLLLDDPKANKILTDGRVTDLLLNLTIALQTRQWSTAFQTTSDQRLDYLRYINKLREEGHDYIKELQAFHDFSKKMTDASSIFVKQELQTDPQLKLLRGLTRVKSSIETQALIQKKGGDFFSNEFYRRFYQEGIDLAKEKIDKSLQTILPKALVDVITDYIFNSGFSHGQIKEQNKTDLEPSEPLVLLS